LLKIQICEIDPMFEEFGEGSRQIGFDQAEWSKQGVAGNRKMAN
jgi:hypothetical protein